MADVSDIHRGTGSLGMCGEDTVEPNQGEAAAGQRKMAARSEVWLHFTRLEHDSDKAKCHYCPAVLCCESTRNGTSSLKSHLKTCKKHPHRSNTTQTQLSFQRSADGSSSLVPWQWNAEAVRKAFTRMIIIDELPFIFPEKEGFRDFMAVACPQFDPPSRTTMYRDVLHLYEDEKAKLKKYFKDSRQTVSLTTDTRTSSTNQSYMVLTAHYIDKSWQLNKKIINFILVDSHKGEDIGKALEKCLIEWGIENVCTITVDNASNNDGAVGYMRSALANRGGTFAKGKYLHMRCVAHILNLVVQDGLKTMAPSITRIRNAIKYVRSSPSRGNTFKYCVQICKIQSQGLVGLDVCTRWNSTYVMLETAAKFEKAFERLLFEDPSYKEEMNDLTGPPTHDDWVFADEFKEFLKHFYDLTEKISGSKYVTSNTFFEDIAGVNYLLSNMSQRADDDDDDTFKHMAAQMKLKYDKYWGDSLKMNDMIFIASMLDPRNKQSIYLYDIVHSTYGPVNGEKIWTKAKKALSTLFTEYKEFYSQVGGQGDSQSAAQSLNTSDSATGQSKSDSRNFMRSVYNKRMRISSDVREPVGKNELDKYLAEDVEEEHGDFYILNWWKDNSARFPVLSRMAADILAIPISTVASESAFSTSGRVIGDYRSSLTPFTLQCLICAQDWLRGPKRKIVSEDIANLSKFEGIEDILGQDAGTLFSIVQE